MDEGQTIVDLDLDLHFLRIEIDLLDIKELFGFLKDKIPELIKMRREDINKDIERNIDGFDAAYEKIGYRNSMDSMFDEYKEVDIPRSYYCPIIAILYAICEASIRDISIDLQKEHKCSTELDNEKGSFPQKSKTYFEDKLDVEFFHKNEYKSFEMITHIRHAIAHAHGRMDFVTNINTKKAIKRYAESEDGVSIVDGYLLVSEQFVDQSIAIMNKAIVDLMNRAKGAAKPNA